MGTHSFGRLNQSWGGENPIDTAHTHTQYPLYPGIPFLSFPLPRKVDSTKRWEDPPTYLPTYNLLSTGRKAQAAKSYLPKDCPRKREGGGAGGGKKPISS